MIAGQVDRCPRGQAPQNSVAPVYPTSLHKDLGAVALWPGDLRSPHSVATVSSMC